MWWMQSRLFRSGRTDNRQTLPCAWQRTKKTLDWRSDEVTQAPVKEALKVGAETYEGELEMDYLSRLTPAR
jgi:hypothetical protein